MPLPKRNLTSSFYLVIALLWMPQQTLAGRSIRNLQNSTMTTAIPVPAPTTVPPTGSPTLAPTPLPTPAPTTAPDFTQINELLGSVELMLPSTTVSPEADADGCGVLGAIDLQIELMVTDQVNEFLEGQELDIPTDIFQLGRRRELLAIESSAEQRPLIRESLTSNSDRDLQDVCVGAGNSDPDPILSIDSILELLRFQLELNLDDDIDEILKGLEFDIPTTTIELSDFLQGANSISDNTAAAEAFRRAAVMDAVQQALQLSFGEELSNFIKQFVIEVPNQEQQQVTLLSRLLDLDVTNIVCRDFGLSELDIDIVFNSEPTGLNDLDVDISVSGKDVSAVCTGDVLFQFALLKTQGSFESKLRFQDFDLGFNFAGGALSTTNCKTRLQIDDVDLSNVQILFINVGDDFVNAAFNLLQGFILNILELFVNPQICNLINSGVGGVFGNSIASRFSEDTSSGASAFDTTEGSLTLRKGRCSGFQVNGGFEVSASVNGLNIDADVAAGDASVTCAGQVQLDLFGIEAQARFTVMGSADGITLGIQYDGGISFDSCEIIASVDSVEVDDVRVESVDVPEELTDHTVDMVSTFVLDLVNARLGDAACGVLDGSQSIPGFSPFGSNNDGSAGTTQSGLDAQVELIGGTCRDVTVGDVSVGTNEVNDQTLAVDVDVKGVDLTCEGTIAFEFAGVKGTVGFIADATVRKFNLDLFLVAETRLCEQFPSSGCVESCRTKIFLDDLQLINADVRGVPDTLVDEIVEVLEDPVRDVIDSLAGDAACSALDGLVPGLIEGFLPAPDGTPTQTFTLIDTVCTDLSVESLDLSSSQLTAESVLLPLNLESFDITCNGDINFQLAQLGGSASFSVNVTSTADIVFNIMSQNYSMFPPNVTSLDSCIAALTTNTASLANLAVDDLPELLTETLLGFVDGLIGTIIAEQGPSLICGAVDNTTFLTNLIDQLSDPIFENLPPRDPVNPLTTEDAFNSTEVLLDFTGGRTSSVDFFASIITSGFLNPSFVVANIISGLLNNESALVLDGDALGLGDALSFETDFALINATLGQLSVFGLDSLSALSIPEVYGNYTLGSTFKFDQVDLIADLDLMMYPKDSGDSLIGLGGDPIVESVQVKWNTTHLAGNFSIFLAINVEEFSVVPPSALITNAASVLPCLLGSLEGLELPQLEFSLDFADPIVTGFSTTGTERLVKGLIEALFLMYGPSLSLAMPGFSQNLLLPRLNEFIAGAISGNQTCPFTPAVVEVEPSGNTTTRLRQ